MRICAFTFLTFAWSALGGQAFAQSEFKVTLLGTGSPAISLQRFGASTLVEVADKKFLFDAGRGAVLRLGQLSVPIAKIDALFITHFHSDHTVDVPDVWLTGWLPSGGQRKKPFQVYGPSGTRTFVKGLAEAYADDVRIRIDDQQLPTSGAEIVATEFNQEGTVYDVDGVKVTAFEVFHGEKIKPSFGYRIDFGVRSGVISGDTQFTENIIKYGMGVDLLIHEVAIVKPEVVAKDPISRLIYAHHTSPREAGEVFRRARPKMAAFTHIIVHRASSLDELLKETREVYDGPLEVGEDLMTFDIKDRIVVTRRGTKQ